MAASMRVAVMTHISRSAKPVVDAVRAQGMEPLVSLSDFLLVRDPRWKYQGIYENFRAIMAMGFDQTEDWIVILHDDVILPLGALAKIAHVLQFATAGMVSFYNPDNGSYTRALAEGHHVVKTSANYWTQCFCFRRTALQAVYDWGTAHVVVGVLAEDGYIKRYCARTGQTVQVVVPSFVQHNLNIVSTYGHPALAGRYLRRSATYDPNFDVFAVDWPKEFTRPFMDRTKCRDGQGLKGFDA